MNDELDDQADDQQETASPDELRRLMEELKLHNAALSRMLAVDKGAPGRWLATEVPSWVITHLEAVRELRSICSVMQPGTTKEGLPTRLHHLGIYLTGDFSSHSILTKGNGDKLASAEPTEPTMGKEEFLDALRVLGWRQADACRRLGCVPNTASRWAKGKQKIPAWVAAHLSMLMEIARLHRMFVQPIRERRTRSGP